MLHSRSVNSCKNRSRLKSISSFTETNRSYRFFVFSYGNGSRICSSRFELLWTGIGKVGTNILRNWSNLVPDLIQDTSREKGLHKIRYNQRHHQRQAGEQPFSIQLVTGWSNIKHIFLPIFSFNIKQEEQLITTQTSKIITELK